MNAFDIPEVNLTPPDLPEGERVYPKCSICGEKIRDEHYYFINDEFICTECLNENYRMKTEDFPQW